MRGGGGGQAPTSGLDLTVGGGEPAQKGAPVLFSGHSCVCTSPFPPARLLESMSNPTGVVFIRVHATLCVSRKTSHGYERSVDNTRSFLSSLVLTWPPGVGSVSCWWVRSRPP